MTHDEIAADDVIDRYVRGQLDVAASNAFEEHYFECDECFARVEELEALRVAVGHAVADGTLTAEAGPVSTAAPGAHRTAPAGPSMVMTWLPLAASLALAAGLGWMAFVQMPQLRDQVAAISADRDQLKGALDQAAAKAAAPVAPPAAIEANVAMVTLASERGVESTPAVTIPAGAAHFFVVIDGPPSPNGRGKLDISANGGASLTSVTALVRDANGVWTVSLPAALFSNGTYRFRLSADAPGGALLGEYILKVTRAPSR